MPAPQARTQRNDILRHLYFTDNRQYMLSLDNWEGILFVDVREVTKTFTPGVKPLFHRSLSNVRRQALVRVLHNLKNATEPVKFTFGYKRYDMNTKTSKMDWQLQLKFEDNSYYLTIQMDTLAFTFPILVNLRDTDMNGADISQEQNSAIAIDDLIEYLSTTVPLASTMSEVLRKHQAAQNREQPGGTPSTLADFDKPLAKDQYRSNDTFDSVF